MYTLYVNDSPLVLAGPGEGPAAPPELTLRYVGKRKFLLQVVGTLEGGRQPDGALLRCDDPAAAWAELRSLYTEIAAAGGAVRNDGRVLCIYRRGAWDLPKGKIDDGESPAGAALREVNEETGLTELSIVRSLPTTFHTYRSPKGKGIFKPTYWYEMATPRTTLVPQAEEDIEEARWVSPAQLPELRARMYRSLWAVVDALTP